MKQQLQEVLQAYGFKAGDFKVVPFGTGLINNTWRLINSSKNFILQRINSNVFVSPDAIAENIRLIGQYLHHYYPTYFFVMPVSTTDGQELVKMNDNSCFRLFPFVANSYTIDKVTSKKQAYEAAKQFGKFTKMLSRFPSKKLHITLADFHNLTLRYAQFEKALKDGNAGRIKKCEEQIDFLTVQKKIVEQYEYIKNSSQFKLRVTHHDTKISNILFDENDNGICVIDLDTLMPGYFISDVGDMIRTYVSPVNEEEQDFCKIDIRTDVFEALIKGYLTEMKEELTGEEKKYLIYSGEFMIYMQALRFLTDYLNNDVYYTCKYETHNFIRACNQIELLKKLFDKKMILERIVASF